MNNDPTHEDPDRHSAICLLGHDLARQRKHMTLIAINMVVNMGRISVILSEDLEKALRYTTIADYGGRKGDLTRAVADAITTWVAKKRIEEKNMEHEK